MSSSSRSGTRAGECAGVRGPLSPPRRRGAPEHLRRNGRARAALSLARAEVDRRARDRARDPRVLARGSADSGAVAYVARSEEHTSELQSRFDLVCRLLLEKKKK